MLHRPSGRFREPRAALELRSRISSTERRSVLFAAVDIDKHAFQAAVLDPAGGEVIEGALLGRPGESWALG
jgi:hypothetical protein